MKRPFSILGGAAFAASFLSLFINPIFATIFLLATIVFLVLSKVEKSRVILGVVLLVTLIFSILNFTYCIFVSKDVLGQQEIEAKIIDLDETLGYNRITIKTRVNSIKLKAELLDFSKGSYTKGDLITVKATLEQPSRDEIVYLYSKGVYLCGQVNEVTEKSEGKGIYKLGHCLTEYIKGSIKSSLDNNDSAPLIAILTGDRSSFDKQTESAIKASGTSHIMVVSGLHLGIICGAVVSLLNKVRAGRKTVFLGGTISIFSVLLICGFHISAIRAATTYLVMLVALLIRKQADALNSLGFSVFAIICANPLIAGNVSFLLSVSATFGVIVVAPKLKNICVSKRFDSNTFLDGLLDAVCVSVSALLCTMPVLIFYFGQISVAAIFVNLLITYAVSLTLILTVIGVLASVIPVVAAVIFNIVAILSRYVMWVINGFGGKEQFVIYFNSKGAVIVSVLSLALMLGIIYFDMKKRGKEIRNDGKREEP